MVDNVIEKKFPVECLIPKNETGAQNFITKYPEFNGDGVTIAIFDSGVDPRAAGLQTSPDGTTKVIERFDCSGAGDVDTTKKVTATDGTIVGLSGRKLKLTEAMRQDNTAGDEYRVGLKCILDLYPTKIKERIIADAKAKTWDGSHKKAIAAAARQIDAFEAAGKSNSTSPAPPLPLSEKLKKENLEHFHEFITSFEKKFAEIRPTYDCILYRTTEHWIVIIDTTETGDLENALVLGEYSKTHDLKTINDQLSVSINVHDDGNVLEIVGMCSSHGTHVAAIAAASHEDTSLNGIAPAAKIVSLTIGDTRIGSMETGTGLVRAMIKVMELCESGRRVHIINMSYGEHSHWSSSGRVGEIMSEVVNKYGVVWVTAASNHGPALCTIGTPPDMSQPSFIGVGAYVSPEMIEAEYAFRQKLPANCYTWSSRDPCIDGGQGVTVCAPGAAIASVPQFTNAKQQLMHGTSMASPHVAGSVALIISGLLKNNVNYSPFSIKRALWNTATRLDYVDPFAQGNGLLNVERAFDHLNKYQDHPETMVQFNVLVNHSSKGIHIRQENPQPKEFPINVDPVFMNDQKVSSQDKVAFNVRLTLVASEPWVQVGSFLDLSYTSRDFSVKVDPSSLPHGVHSARVLAYDSANIAKGTLFEVPITVVQPIICNITESNMLTIPSASYKARTINRQFIYVPRKATWAVLKLRSPNTPPTIPARFMVHTMQVLPQKFCKALETQKLLSVSGELWTVHAFRCEENNVLEVCIAKFWSNLGDSQLEATISFRGIHSNGAHVMHSANGIHRIDLTTMITEEIAPAIQLKTAVQVVKPTESKILPLTHRDVIAPGRQIYQNMLTYNVHLNKNQELSLHVPLLSTVLYESEFEAQLWQLFDTNKMQIHSGDAYSNLNFIKVDKGDYVVKLQVRHEKREILEKVSEAVLIVTIKLTNPIPLDVFSSYKNAINSGKKCPSFQVHRDIPRPIYVAPLPNEKITKGSVPTQSSWLDGTISCAKDEIGRKVEHAPFRYMLIEGPPNKKPNGFPKDASKNKWEEYKEGLRDYQNSMIAKLDLEKAEEVYQKIIEEFPDFLSAHISMINKLDLSSELKNQLPFTYRASLAGSADLQAAKDVLQRVVMLANIVIKETDSDALLAYYGLKSDSRTDAVKIKTNMDKQKANLMEAYVKKAIALSKICIIESIQNKGTDDDTDSSSENTTTTASSASSNAATTKNELSGAVGDSLSELDNIYVEVGKFIDYMDIKVILVTLWHSYQHQHYGRMLKSLIKLFEDKMHKDILEELRHVTAEAKLNHISASFKQIHLLMFPPGYRLF